jgi:superfamily II DNA or RNA helicase
MVNDDRFDDRPCSVRRTKKNNAWKLDELKVLARASGMSGYTKFKTKRELCRALGRKHSDVVLKRTKTKVKKVEPSKVPIGQEGAKLTWGGKKKKTARKSKKTKADLFGPNSGFPSVPLMAHQAEVAERIISPCIRGLILYFGVGSGKTLSAMAAAEALFSRGIVQSAIVVTPASLIKNFEKEIQKFKASKKKYTVMSFEGFVKKAATNKGMAKNKILIIDEAHNLRNSAGKMSKAVMDQAKSATKVLLLTGTPIQNHPNELSPLINMIDLGRNGVPVSKKAFDDRFGDDGLSKGQSSLKKAVECTTLYYRPKDNDPEYPTICSEDIMVKMTEAQRKAQQDFADAHPNILLNDVLQQKKNVMTFFSSPRQVANALTKDGKTDAPKFVEALARLKKAHTAGEKSIVYSNYLEKGIGIMEGLLKDAHITYKVVSGKESKNKKQEAIDAFNGGRVKVLLLSSAGGEGHDLKGTHHVHIMEPAFNDARIEQVIGRARRRGSHKDTAKKHVKVHKYYAIMNLTDNANANGFKLLENWSADQILKRFSETKDKVNRQFLKAVLDWNEAAKARCLKC